MRRLTILIPLLLLLTLIFPYGGHAQQAAGLAMEASALYDGYVKYGEWLPIQVTLANDGPDVRGRVQVARASRGAAVQYAQEIELPRGARKQVTIHTVSTNFTRRLRVDFVPEGAAEPLLSSEVDILPVVNIQFVTAVVSGGGDGLEPLAGIDFRDERAPRGGPLLVRMTLEELPDRPEPLRTLDLIILSGIDTRVLSPRQQQALEQYVALGGILVLGGGEDAARVLAGMPETLRPVALDGQTTLDQIETLGQIAGEPLRVAGPFAVARAAPLDGAEVLYSEQGLPLVVRQDIGEGALFWMALDPARSPFDAWAGTDEFWLGLIGALARYPAELPPDISPRQMANDQLAYALQNLPSLDLPSLRLIIPLLGLYILVVGPLNYLLLRRGRRLEMAWVTIPLITLAFSAGAYGLGFRLRGSDVIINQISVVRAIPGSEGGTVRSMIGLFSPSRQQYDLSIAGEPLLSSAQPGEAFGATSSTLDATLLQGEPARVADLTVNQWSMQSVLAESIVPTGFGLDSELTLSDDRLQGTITNRGERPWTDVVLIFGNDFVRLGDMAPGQSADVSLPVAARRNPFGPDIAWRIWQPQGPNDRTLQVKQQVVSAIFNNPVSSISAPGASTVQPQLLAWMEGGVNRVTIEGVSRPREVGTTLLHAELPLGFRSGELRIPPGLIPARLIRSNGNECYGQGTIGLAPGATDAELGFTLPDALRTFEPASLTLHLTSEGGWFAAPPLALYNFELGDWESLVDPILGANRVIEPDRFLGPGGELRLLVEGEQQRGGGCLFFDLELTGEMPGSSASSATEVGS